MYICLTMEHLLIGGLRNSYNRLEYHNHLDKYYRPTLIKQIKSSYAL